MTWVPLSLSLSQGVKNPSEQKTNFQLRIKKEKLFTKSTGNVKANNSQLFKYINRKIELQKSSEKKKNSRINLEKIQLYCKKISKRTSQYEYYLIMTGRGNRSMKSLAEASF